MVLGRDGLVDVGEWREPQRQRFEATALRGTAPRFLLAWTDEDRRQRRLFTASVGAGGETPTIELHPVLDVPGPVGGIEQVLGGPIPVVLSEGSGARAPTPSIATASCARSARRTST